jgi:hypothetical protein
MCGKDSLFLFGISIIEGQDLTFELPTHVPNIFQFRVSSSFGAGNS